MASTSPFDAFAADYDIRFSERLPVTWLRTAVYERIAPLLGNGARVIELGCGTGEDAIWLARQGCDVWATDASSGMLGRARIKIDELDLGSRISLQQINLTHWQPADLPTDFRAHLVFSNFGALNCVEDVRPVFRAAWQCLNEGGYLAVSLMGRFCLSETVYFGIRGQFTKAVRRWRAKNHYQAGGEWHPVWYHSPADLRSQAENFEQRSLYGIGGLLPPSEGFGLCERWPALFGQLARWDRRLGRYLYPISDHYLMILQKIKPSQ